MKVELISVTPDALNLLLRTKNTRLKFESDPATWTEEERREHLDYMRNTIKSSWEFVDYVFQIDGVTRAFTHQLVRTRTGSYAQQAMRVLDARDHGVERPAAFAEQRDLREIWDEATKETLAYYGDLLDHGAAPQDARGILPTNIHTAITAKFNLRTLHEMAKLRLCTRTQGEYQDAFRLMRTRVLEVHPWAEGFLEVYCVAHGECAFPAYGPKECPVWFEGLDNRATKEEARERFWNARRHEASPRAKNGKAM